MELRVLKYFLAVAREENITRAAERLHTTQSNLSRQLAELETDLGKQLFHRGSRRITLTEEGRLLRRRAREILDLAERTEAELASFSDEPVGVVRIGAAETRIMRKISEIILALRADHPRVTFDIFSGSTLEVTDRVHAGLIDFGILVTPLDLSEYDYLTIPIKDTFGLLMRKDNPLAAKDAITPADLADAPVLVARQQLDGNVLSGWLGRGTDTLHIVSTFNLITTPAMMVEAGLGSAFTFDRLVPTPPESPLCFRPLAPRVEATLCLVWKKYQILTPAAKLFLEALKKEMENGPQSRGNEK